MKNLIRAKNLNGVLTSLIEDYSDEPQTLRNLVQRTYKRFLRRPLAIEGSLYSKLAQRTGGENSLNYFFAPVSFATIIIRVSQVRKVKETLCFQCYYLRTWKTFSPHPLKTKLREYCLKACDKHTARPGFGNCC